jgi:hypothetical protein
MIHKFRKVMKRHSFVSRLLMLISLGASMNACMIANYQTERVTVAEQLNDDTPYSQILSMATLSVIPAYTTRKYVLNYSLLYDYKAVKEYEYHITEKAVTGLVSWLLFPVMYPFWRDIEMVQRIDARTDAGPPNGAPSRLIREVTKTFLLEARRDGIL